MNFKIDIFASSPTRCLYTALALLLLPVFSMAQERIAGNGDWETAYDVVYPDGTRGGLIRQRFFSESACLSTRNRIVQEAQASFEGIDQQYEPYDNEWKAMEAKANLTPCRNIATGQVSSGNVPGGFSGRRYNAGPDCVDMTSNSCSPSSGNTAGGSSQAAEVQRKMDQLATMDSTETQGQIMGEAIAEAYGGSSAEAAALGTLFGDIFGAMENSDNNKQRAPENRSNNTVSKQPSPSDCGFNTVISTSGSNLPELFEQEFRYERGCDIAVFWYQIDRRGYGRTYVWSSDIDQLNNGLGAMNGRGEIAHVISGPSYRSTGQAAPKMVSFMDIPHTLGAIPPPPSTVRYDVASVLGTTWAGEDSFGRSLEFHFMSDGVLNFVDMVGSFINGGGSWKQDGSTVFFEIANHAMEYYGTIRGHSIEGNVWHKTGNRWEWSAVKKNQPRAPAATPRNGQGTYTWPDGDKYVGQYVNGVRNGQGTYTWANGQKYVGQYRDGKENGQGTMTYPDGRTYVGQYVDGKKNGQGTMTYPNGDKYVGQYVDDRKKGQGTTTWASGYKYVGQYRDGKENGQGTMTYPSEDKYVGQFRDGKRNGQGTMTWLYGRKHEGQWANSKPHGQGTSTYPDGRVESGQWENGELVEPE